MPLMQCTGSGVNTCMMRYSPLASDAMYWQGGENTCMMLAYTINSRVAMHVLSPHCHECWQWGDNTCMMLAYTLPALMAVG